MTDDELTDAWEGGRVFEGGVTREQHVRIAWVLHRRHRPEEALKRLLEGTRRACQVHRCPEKFDPELTERWANAVAQRAARSGIRDTASEFVARHPELLHSHLLDLRPTHD